jgi:hypothetical protein
VEVSHHISQSVNAHNQSTRQRDKPLDQTLYEDAERRRRDLERLRQEVDKSRANPSQSKFFNENSDKYVVNKFDREVAQLEQEYAHEQADDENTETTLGLNYEKMV